MLRLTKHRIEEAKSLNENVAAQHSPTRHGHEDPQEHCANIRRRGENIVKTPKLLPWYAHRTGISIERAETLWRRAVRTATAETGWVGNAEYWGACMDGFLALLEQERNTLCAPQVVPFVRSHNRMWRLPLLAMEDIFAAFHAHWQRTTGGPHKAA